MVSEQTKKEIDAMNYEQMLSNWRFCPAGSHLFQGDTGQYFSKVMQDKKSKLAAGQAAQISKDVGWE